MGKGRVTERKDDCNWEGKEGLITEKKEERDREREVLGNRKKVKNFEQLRQQLFKKHKEVTACQEESGDRE